MFSQLRFARAGVGAPRAVRTSRQRHDGRPESAGPGARHRGVWRLDHPHRARASCPPQAPPRPQGIERNVVITQWDWADPKAYLHDEISTDKRNPNVNANGLIYGSPEESRDYLPVLDPVHNTISQVKIPYRDPDTPGQPKPLAALDVLGRRSHLGQPHHGSQSDVRSARAPVVHRRASAPADNPGVLQGGIEPAFGEAHSGRPTPAASWPSTIRRPSRPR